MIRDAHGHDVTGATEEAVALYDKGVRAFHLGHGDPVGLLDQARAVAPNFVMAHLAKAWMLALANDPMLEDAAAALVATASPLEMNERERTHLAALHQAIARERTSAVAIMDRHVMRYPLDLLGQQAAMLMDGFLGRFRLVRDRTARALPLWSKSMPNYGVMLTWHGFGCEESGDYARAEDEAREGAELEPYGFWPHHTVAHVMEMMGRPQDGLGWMAAREPFWSGPDDIAQVHIWWHRALFHVELGQYDAALDLYDGPLLRSYRPLSLNLTNLSALLWRLDCLGVTIGDRWAALLPLWEGRADGRCLAFADLHAAMAELRSGNEHLVERRLDRMRETAGGSGEPGRVYREVGIPLVEAFVSFHEGNYAAAVEQLHPVRCEVWRIGGSHAQRDVVDWTLTEAALRAGQRDVALALAYERLATRPRSVVNRMFRDRAERVAASRGIT